MNIIFPAPSREQLVHALYEAAEMRKETAAKFAEILFAVESY
jgi:hypothetical protein